MYHCIKGGATSLLHNGDCMNLVHSTTSSITFSSRLRHTFQFVRKSGIATASISCVLRGFPDGIQYHIYVVAKSFLLVPRQYGFAFGAKNVLRKKIFFSASVMESNACEGEDVFILRVVDVKPMFYYCNEYIAPT